MADIPKREQVKLLIEEGVHTKAEIANALSMSSASVSSQMTYLRWMGNNIVTNDDKILSLATAEEFAEWQKDIQAKKDTKKASKSTKSFSEQLQAAEKSLKGSQTALANWETKVVETTEDDIENFEEFTAESSANIVLLEIKIKRTEARIEALKVEVENEPIAEKTEEADTDTITEDTENTENTEKADDLINDLV